jgi:hypothetical protein
VTLSSATAAHLSQAHHPKLLRCRRIDTRRCCCSRTELQNLLLQAYYEDQLAVCRAMEAILREEASLLSDQVRAGSLRVLLAQAS